MTFKLGRKRPLARPPMLRLRNYLLRGVEPPPPARGDYATPAIMGLENVLANDRLGDCTAAGAWHIMDVFRANAAHTRDFVTESDVVAFYSATTGYNPNDPSTDQGGDEITVLNYWRDKGFFADGSGKISGYVSVNAADPVELKTAIWLFGNLYFGVELPDAWVSPFPAASGFTWGAAGPANPSNGHCFVGYGYNAVGIFVDTWGMFGTLTYEACAKYATTAGSGECYSVLSSAWISPGGLSPSGFSMAQLQADLQALA